MASGGNGIPAHPTTASSPAQTELGTACKKTLDAGREYLSVKLDDLIFPAPIYASLVEVEGGDGHALTWSRRNGG